MPKMRLGHGLYMYSLKSKKGKQVLEDLKKYDIVLEFQLSSNVRLNNLNSLENHPLRQYLKAGIRCVQGTDGAALYGTNLIDEQLALEKLLELKPEEMLAMKQAEEVIIQQAQLAYSRKKAEFQALLNDRPLEDVLLEIMDEGEAGKNLNLKSHQVVDANTELQEKIQELPWDKLPVVVMGGSFNTEKRTTHVNEEGIEQLNALMEMLDPEEYFFVIGHKLKGYEKYLLDHNEKHFMIFCIVPTLLSEEESLALMEQDVSIRVSPESEGMGIYKSFNYEIFERRPSILLGFDGNSAGINMMQEAKNGKGKAHILIFSKCKALMEKARSLEGYVEIFDREHPLCDLFREL
jgi:hypothetical protein